MKSVGYDIYDIWDLGEFNYKGKVRTKYGTMKELVELAKTAKEHDVVIYIDAVLNHKFGADDKERFKVREVDNDDRTRFTTGLYEIGVGMLCAIPNVCLTFKTGLDQVYLQSKEQRGSYSGIVFGEAGSYRNCSSPVQRF